MDFDIGFHSVLKSHDCVCMRVCVCVFVVPACSQEYTNHKV